jgi:hypothetical protein
VLFETIIYQAWIHGPQFILAINQSLEDLLSKILGGYQRYILPFIHFVSKAGGIISTTCIDVLKPKY